MGRLLLSVAVVVVLGLAMTYVLAYALGTAPTAEQVADGVWVHPNWAVGAVFGLTAGAIVVGLAWAWRPRPVLGLTSLAIVVLGLFLDSPPGPKACVQTSRDTVVSLNGGCQDPAVTPVAVPGVDQ